MVWYTQRMFLIPDSWYVIKKTKVKGRGVFAARDIEAGTVIGDYLGTITDPAKEDERTNGLYYMAGGEKYDILADPKVRGVHFINHSCSNNCHMYPYQGHILFFALRKIFKGEEISLNYWLYAPDDTTTTCHEHACYCGSAICTGTMHTAGRTFDTWEDLVKKQFGPRYKKIPGEYGDQLVPLRKYPRFVNDHPELYDIFGAENKQPEKYKDKMIPTMPEVRKRIRTTGRQLSFPSLKIVVYGIRDAMLLVKR